MVDDVVQPRVGPPPPPPATDAEDNDQHGNASETGHSPGTNLNGADDAMDTTEEEAPVPDDPDDQYKPEGTIYLDVDHFSDFARGPNEQQQRLSKPVFVRGLPWKILAMPRDSQNTARGDVRRPVGKQLGFFLQCNGDEASTGWSCMASAALKMVPWHKDEKQEPGRKITHNFYSKENDWGYANFMSCEQIITADGGYVRNDTIRLMVHVTADAPHGVQWDSKKHTGFIGLKNQGATCYMNSILQTLYFTNKLRQAVYWMPTRDDEAGSSVALAMQRVFYELQHSDKPVGTKKLTRSFGWNSLDSFLQHDVQELCRVLLDNLESKMKSTKVQDTIPWLFKGRMRSYIRCSNVDFESSREEFFYDVQLNVKGQNNVLESFRDYVQTEKLEGDNAYDAGEHGMQEAIKGVSFISFPPVLHLQLMRFQYDPMMDANVKINDRFEFPEKLDLSEFIDGSDDEEKRGQYHLHAVLVHSGDFHGGHYVVFINTDMRADKPRWCKFDDDVVSRATVQDAVQNNYGGDDSERPARSFTNAYMLVYVRENAIEEVLSPVDDKDIPLELRERFQREADDDARRKREKQEAHLYTEIVLIRDADFQLNHGFDLIDQATANAPRATERVSKKMLVSELYEFVADRLFNTSLMNVSPNHFRLWLFLERSMHDRGLMVHRPAQIIDLQAQANEQIDKMMEGIDRTQIYVEEALPSPLDGRVELCPFDSQNDLLVFLKFYHAASDRLAYIGPIALHLKAPLDNSRAELCARAGLPPDTKLRHYEEVSPGRVVPIDSTKNPTGFMAELHDGLIIIYESDADATVDRNAKIHTERMFNEIQVELVPHIDSTSIALGCQQTPVDQPADQPIEGRVDLRWTLRKLTDWMSERLDADRRTLLLYRCSTFQEKPVQQVLATEFDQITVAMLLSVAQTGQHQHDPRIGKTYRVFYVRMPFKVSDMERRQQMRVRFLEEKNSVREVTLFPGRQGTAEELLHLARTDFRFAQNDGGSGKLRIVLVGAAAHTAQRVFRQIQPSQAINELVHQLQSGTYVLRIEEIPADQLEIRQGDEMLLPVAHIDKTVDKTHGVPFLFKVVNGEPYSSIRERLRTRLDVSPKEFDKWKIALVVQQRILKTLDASSEQLAEQRVNLNEMQHTGLHITGPTQQPWIALDHPNKQRGMRGSHVAEKPIIIHN